MSDDSKPKTRRSRAGVLAAALVVAGGTVAVDAAAQSRRAGSAATGGRVAPVQPEPEPADGSGQEAAEGEETTRPLVQPLYGVSLDEQQRRPERPETEESDGARTRGE